MAAGQSPSPVAKVRKRANQKLYRSAMPGDQARRCRDIYAAPRRGFYVVLPGLERTVEQIAREHGRPDLVVVTLIDAVAQHKVGIVRPVSIDHETYQMFDELDWQNVYWLLANQHHL